jgi:preprotein translocase subunit SecD
MHPLFRKWQVLLWIAMVSLAALLIFNVIPVNPERGVGLGNGLDYGLDFAGGIEVQLQMEKPVDEQTMAVEKGILESRLNSLGLKDIPVRPWGDRYLLIQIAGASPAELGRIIEILQQQANFEMRIDGLLAMEGDELSVDMSPSGMGVSKATSGYSWFVSVKNSPSGACRFGEVGSGKMNRPVDLFIDRPRNATVVFSEGKYELLGNLTSSSDRDSFYYGNSALDVVVNRSAVPVVVHRDDNESLRKLLELKNRGFNTVYLAGSETEISDYFRNMLEENGLKTYRKPQVNASYESWIKELVGLQSSLRLAFDPQGKCQYENQITGYSNTLEEARNDVKETQVLLTSGNLPVKLEVVSESTTPPTLGVKFLRYSAVTGFIALVTVGFIILLRYRNPLISLPIMLTDISEVTIVLGFAALINWDLDLPSMAGIIAAVGTGVNDQIIITDEVLSGRKEVKKFFSVGEQVRKAFYIVFMAASTIIAAMLPILSIGAGMLKGFAFTTIMGVLIGIFITRPGYAKVIEHVLREKGDVD